MYCHLLKHKHLLREADLSQCQNVNCLLHCGTEKCEFFFQPFLAL